MTYCRKLLETKHQEHENYAQQRSAAYFSRVANFEKIDAFVANEGLSHIITIILLAYNNRTWTIYADNRGQWKWKKFSAR